MKSRGSQLKKSEKITKNLKKSSQKVKILKIFRKKSNKSPYTQGPSCEPLGLKYQLLTNLTGDGSNKDDTPDDIHDQTLDNT